MGSIYTYLLLLHKVPDFFHHMSKAIVRLLQTLFTDVLTAALAVQAAHGLPIVLHASGLQRLCSLLIQRHNIAQDTVLWQTTDTFPWIDSDRLATLGTAEAVVMAL